MDICRFIETYYTDQTENRTNENETATNTACIYQKQTHLVSLYTDTNPRVK